MDWFLYDNHHFKSMFLLNSHIFLAVFSKKSLQESLKAGSIKINGNIWSKWANIFSNVLVLTFSPIPGKYSTLRQYFLVFCVNYYRSRVREVFLEKGSLKICSKFKGEYLCQSAISIKLPCNFIEITLWHRCHPVNFLHISKTPVKSCFCYYKIKKQSLVDVLNNLCS